MGRASRQKRERRNTKKALNVKPGPPFSVLQVIRNYYIFGVIVISATMAITYWLMQPATATIAGSLKGVDVIKTTFNTPIEDRTSPACGCMYRRDDTAGVAGFSTRLTFRIQADNPAFTLISRPPSPNDIFPELSFSVSIVQISTDDTESIFSRDNDPQTLHRTRVAEKTWPTQQHLKALFDDPDKHRDVVRHAHFEEVYVLDIHGVDTLRMWQSGTFPYFSWNPAASTALDISLDAVREAVTIKEEAHQQNSKISSKNNTINFIDYNIHPFADLVGVPVFFWSNEVEEVLVNDESPMPSESDQERVTFFKVDASYSIRMIPFSTTEPSSSVENISENQIWMSSDPNAEVKHPRVEITYLARGRNRTTYALTASLGDSIQDDFNTSKHLSGSTSVVGSSKWLGRPIEVQYRYPDLSPELSLNIWGATPWVEFHGAKGGILYGTNQKPIVAPADIRFEFAEDAPNYQRISLSHDGVTEVKKETTQVTVDGNVAFTNFDMIERKYAILALAASFGGGMWWAWRKWTKQ